MRSRRAPRMGRLRATVAALAVVVGALAWFGSVKPLTASATVNGCSSSSVCRWTEMFNNDWPNNGGSPYCNPCQAWVYDFTGSYNNAWYGTHSSFENEVNWAANYWSDEQFNSPWFQEANGCNGCGSPVLWYSAQGMGSNTCGYTVIDNGNNYPNITTATVWLNSNLSYTDGPREGNAPCDLRDTLLHETGHVTGEGHSSVSSDLMYAYQNDVEVIDQDAQNMLAAVYGTYEGGCSGDYCGGNADIAVPTPIYLRPMSPAQLETTVLEKAQAGVRSVQAERADAGNIAQSMEQVPHPTLCPSTKCEGPAGG